jgi:MFS family permease
MQSIAGLGRRGRSSAEVEPPPSRGREPDDAHRIPVSRAAAGTAVFAIAVASFTRIPLLPDIGATLSLSGADLGLLTAAFGLGRLLTDLPAGRIASSISPRRGLAGAGVAMAIACALLATAGSFAQALVASALIGSASALTNTTGMYAFATAGGAERRGANMALFSSALMSGQTVGPAVGGALAALAGWRGALGLAAAIGLAVAVGSIVRSSAAPRASAIPAPDAARAPRPDHPAAERERGDESKARIARPSRGELAAIAAAPFAVFFVIGGVSQTLIPLIGGRELGLSASTIGLAIALGGATRFPAAWIAGSGPAGPARPSARGLPTHRRCGIAPRPPARRAPVRRLGSRPGGCGYRHDRGRRRAGHVALRGVTGVAARLRGLTRLATAGARRPAL